MARQFGSRIKLGLGFALGFQFFYLSRADYYAHFVHPPRYYQPPDYEYGCISELLNFVGEVVMKNSTDYLLHSDILTPLNFSAFIFFVFLSGARQTILLRIEIGSFLILDTALLYEGLRDPVAHFRFIDASVVFNYYIPLALGVYFIFLLRRIAKQISSDEEDMDKYSLP